MAEVEEPTTLSTTSTPEKIRPALLSYDEIPEWYQDNAFIRHGYRPESNSARACFTSWIYLHNESVNIYSHLLPAVLFLVAEGLIAHYFQVRYPDASIGDRLVFAFFLLTATTCLGMSATFHTLLNHSIGVSHLWLRLDFVGIIVLTLGKFVSGIYMIFYCEPVLRWIYWAMARIVACYLGLESLKADKYLLFADTHTGNWDDHHTGAPQVPRSTLAYLSCVHFRRYRAHRLRSPCTRNQALWLAANGEAVWYSILPRRRSFADAGGSLLHGQCYKT